MSGDPALRRFAVIQAMRWLGIVLALVGLLALYGRLGLPHAIGYVLVPLGLLAALIAPTVLARRWKSPPP